MTGNHFADENVREYDVQVYLDERHDMNFCRDFDGDGLPNEVERDCETDAINDGTDGDGVSDRDEEACNSSPLDAHFTCENLPSSCATE